jgi:hypothetical protein
MISIGKSALTLVLAATLSACGSMSPMADKDAAMDDATMKKDEAMAAMPGMATASLMLADQPAGTGSSVVIEELTLDKPGFVVIHQEADGKPGPVIGHSDLIVPGSYKNYSVGIDSTMAGSAVYPMLHYDNGDGNYEFPGPDGPVKVDDKVVMGKVNWQ